MRLIDADALIEILKRNKQFFIDAWGGSFHAMSEKDKARCDEIDNCIAEILTAPTIEPDGDTISRQAVLDALEKSGYCYHFWIDIENIINSLPSAEPKTAYWIPNLIDLGFGKPVVDSYSCSECKEECNLNYDYCPNCGARMLGEDGEA